MKCRQAKKLLSPYIDDELSDAERAALEEHLESCDACRSELEALRKISEGLRGIYRDVKAPPDFLDKLMKRIQELEEEKATRLVESGPLVFPKNWLKVAAVATLAAGLGLGIYQYSRAQDAGSIGSYNLASPVVEAPAGGEKLHAGNQEKSGESPAPAKEIEEQQFVAPSGGSSPKQVAAEVSLPGAAKESPGTTPAGQGQKEKLEGARKDPSGGAAVREPVAFLSRTRHVRTTMIKLEVDNLPYAKEVVAVLAEQAGAERPKEVWVYQQEEIILRAVLPVGTIGQFLEKVAKLGKEVDQKTETVDVTAEFNRQLLEYQELAGKQDTESQVRAGAIERQLQDLDRETLEVGKEVVNIWLKLR